jgi:hypothetical protein
MKKLLSLLCVISVCLITQAANKISLTSAKGHPGDEVSVNLSLVNTDEITALEVNLPLGNQMSYVDGSFAVESSRMDGHDFTVKEVEHTLKIYIYSLSLKNIKGNDGNLLSFKLKLGKEPADYELRPSVLLSKKDGSKVDASVSSGMVTILSPKLLIENNMIDFGHVPIRSSYTNYLNLRNVGNESLTVTDITTSNASLSPSEKSAVIAAGGSHQVPIVYKPAERGAINEYLTVTSNSVDGSMQKASIKADPYSVNELHVGNASGISDETVQVNLSMDNMEPIVAMQCSFNLPKELKYVENSAKLTSRATNHVVKADYTNNKLTLYVYSPTNEPLSQSTGDCLTFNLQLNGSNGYYSLNPENVVLSNKALENMVSASSPGYVTIQSPSMSCESNLNFGEQSITDSVKAVFSISNNGQVPLVIDKVTFLSEGYKIINPLPLKVNAYGTGKIEVLYLPAKEGKFGTTMNIYTNDPSNRMKSVAVSGEVFEPNVMSLSSSNSKNGNSILKIDLKNYTSLVALQADIHLPDGLTIDTQHLKSSSRLSNHSCIIQDIKQNTYRLLIYSLANQKIAGNEGEICQVELLRGNGSHYDGKSVILDNEVFSDANGKSKQSQSSTSLSLQELYTLNVQVDSTSHGTVEGSGQFKYNSANSIKATPSNGFVFKSWSDGVVENPRSVVLISDTTITACFTVNPDVNAVSSVNSDTLSVLVKNGNIVISGANIADIVTVYGMNGEHIYSGKDKEITICSSGLYYVKVAGRISKIVVQKK